MARFNLWVHPLNRQMKVARVIATGGVVWTFAVFIPLNYLALWARLTPSHLAMVFAPLLLLVTGALAHKLAVTVLAFPLSLLPILVRFPALTGPRIYGATAFAALAAATLLHLFTASSPPSPARPPVSRSRRRSQTRRSQTRRTRNAHLLTAYTLAFFALFVAVAYVVHFHRPVRIALDTTHGATAGRAMVAIGLLLFVVWAVAVVRYLIVGLGGVLQQPTRLMGEWYRFGASATAGLGAGSPLAWALLVALGGGAALFLMSVFGG